MEEIMKPKEFKCAICGNMFSDLSPIHEKRCVCMKCYKILISETFDKKVEKLSMKDLKKIAKK